MVNEIKRQEETYGIEFDAELAKSSLKNLQLLMTGW